MKFQDGDREACLGEFRGEGRLAGAVEFLLSSDHGTCNISVELFDEGVGGLRM